MRYTLLEEPGGLWSVVDGATGKPADLLGVQTEQLDKTFAEDLMAILESQDMKRKLTRGPLWNLK
ncbi:hypothetical protein X733_13630 [Mesorhizobium sp. L2C067A000]|nr:hypothetical protein X733_13630 [Mesorhizobium sp. L2C067A000]